MPWWVMRAISERRDAPRAARMPSSRSRKPTRWASGGEDLDPLTDRISVRKNRTRQAFGEDHDSRRLGAVGFGEGSAA